MPALSRHNVQIKKRSKMFCLCLRFIACGGLFRFTQILGKVHIFYQRVHVDFSNAPLKNNVVPVFYNVFVQPGRSSSAKEIIKEQMALLHPKHKVFVRSIGLRVDVQNATHIRHDENGGEPGTLGLLWDHCRERNDPSEKVVYIHNKGSFHPSKKNHLMRKFLTRGALSQVCMNMPLSCNVCSSRMSPLPFAHTPGNMWLARCDYVNTLIDPLKFEEAMRTKVNLGGWGCDATGRHAAEHWVHSHPSVKPCDLSNSNYTWNYDGVPEDDFEIRLEAAPRFALEQYRQKVCSVKPASQVLSEYRDLYNETPDSLWWGWDFYKV